MKAREYSRPANLVVDVTNPSDTVEAESKANSKQRRWAIFALRYSSDAPESRSVVTFRPSIVADIKASSRFLTAAAVSVVNDRRHGVFIAATVSGMSELVSAEVSGALVFTILARSVQDEKAFFSARALSLAKQTF